MRLLLAPLGSSGDVNPFVGIGVAMRRRGHDVAVVTNAHFAGVVGLAGRDFVASSAAASYDLCIAHLDM